MPFACGERWEGSSRPTHSPSPFAVDWNRDSSDEGHIVVATAPGVVTSVVNLGDTSYGLYVVIDHRGGWTTLHAHLDAAFVSVGERVDQGQVIALLGDSGGSTGPHLHYEQRLDKADQHAAFDGKRFAYDSWLTSRNCTDVPVVGDWNGDRRSEVGTFRHQRGTGVFREALAGGGTVTVPWGLPTDTPVVGDWDGDGQSDLGVWRSAAHRFVLAPPSHSTFSFGDAGDLPVVGDWNGDGIDDVGVFDPSTATFFLRDSGGNMSSLVVGTVSSWPVAGDWDGDGRGDVGVYDTSTATFTLLMPDGTTKTIRYGTRGAIPVVGNWDADPISDVGVWSPTTATFSERLGPKKTRTITFGRARQER
jgi:hypothetical protein